MSSDKESRFIQLSKPKLDGNTSVEAAISKRRSMRRYTDQPLAAAQVSQLLWAAQGITAGGIFRSAPSAGALYPLELYIALGTGGEINAGIYQYLPARHALVQIISGDKRSELADAAIGQDSLRQASAVLIFNAAYRRTTAKYGRQAIRYVDMEVGHAAQNVSLQATALGLGTVPIGAFDGQRIQHILTSPGEEESVYLYVIGYSAESP